MAGDSRGDDAGRIAHLIQSANSSIDYIFVPSEATVTKLENAAIPELHSTVTAAGSKTRSCKPSVESRVRGNSHDNVGKLYRFTPIAPASLGGMPHREFVLPNASRHHPAPNSPNGALPRSKVCIVIPVYNEERVLPELFQRLHALFDSQPEYQFDAILINDGSRGRIRAAHRGACGDG